MRVGGEEVADARRNTFKEFGILRCESVFGQELHVVNLRFVDFDFNAVVIARIDEDEVFFGDRDAFDGLSVLFRHVSEYERSLFAVHDLELLMVVPFHEKIVPKRILIPSDRNKML